MPAGKTHAAGRFWCGIAALGLWLGWTASTFAALSVEPHHDAAATDDIAALIAARLARAGVHAEMMRDATAYVLPDPDCACSAVSATDRGAAVDTTALADALHALDVPLVDLRTGADARTGSYTVALFDAHGALRYAGPPGFSLGCMRGAIASSATIARLLQGSQAVLVPSIPCAC